MRKKSFHSHEKKKKRSRFIHEIQNKNYSINISYLKRECDVCTQFITPLTYFYQNATI